MLENALNVACDIDGKSDGICGIGIYSLEFKSFGEADLLEVFQRLGVMLLRSGIRHGARRTIFYC